MVEALNSAVHVKKALWPLEASIILYGWMGAAYLWLAFNAIISYNKV
jgi:hypothetical protein